MPVSKRLLCTLLVTAFLADPEAAADSRSDPDVLVGWNEYIQPWLLSEHSGLIVFPAEYLGGTPSEVLNPEGYELRMTKADNPGEEQVYLVGEPFHPPKGLWRMWLEGEWSITPYTQLISFASQQARRVGPQLMPIGPGGRVTVLEDQWIDSQHELSLLRLGEHPLGGPNEFLRRRRVSELGKGLLMPEGRAIAVLRNRTGRYIALSRPFSITAETVMPAPLAPPRAEVAHVVLFAQHPGNPWKDPLNDLVLTVEQFGRKHRPEVVLLTEGGMYGIWYDLAPGSAVLEGGNEVLYFEQKTLDLAGATIEEVRVPLRERPSLAVDLVLPSLLRERPLSLVMREMPAGREVVREELGRHEERLRIEDRLTHGMLEVILETYLGNFRRRVDLTSIDEGFLAIEPTLIEVFGTVRHGDEEHSASVLFKTIAGDTVEATADENGEYRSLALQPLVWVQVELMGVKQEPWRDFLVPPITSTRQLDFEIPDAVISVRVVDAISGKGIAGASVSVRNNYRAPAGNVGEENSGEGRGSRALAQSHLTDTTGLARLAPPRPGQIEITASANDYQRMHEPIVLEISDPPQDREIDLLLEPLGDRIQVRLTLPDGSPAIGAEVMHVGSSNLGEVVFNGQADDAGVVEIPVQPAHGAILLRHPQGASGLIERQDWRDENSVEWQFSATAEYPLAIRVVSASEEAPGAGATVCLWIGDRAFSGAALSWLWEGGARTDGNGFWTAHRLPRSPVRVLAISRTAPCTYPTLATEIPYPWPPLVDLKALVP